MKTLLPSNCATRFIRLTSATVYVLAMILTLTMSAQAQSAGPPRVNLGNAERFAVLAHTGITNAGPSVVRGDVGLSPTIGSSIELTQAEVTGSIFTVDEAGPAGSIASASMLVTAKSDLEAAFNDAAGRTLNQIPIAGNLGGLTLTPGLYKSTSTLEISSGNLTLDAQGNADAVWIFQIATSFNMTGDLQVVLVNGANSANIFWQIGTAGTFAATTVMKGTLMAGTQLTFAAGAILDGRALALTTNITLAQNTITRPTSGVATSITGSQGWRLLAAPYNQVKFSILLEPIWTQGSLNSDDPDFDAPNVFRYNETLSGHQDTGYEPISDLNDMMGAGIGYAVYVFSDANGPSSEGNAGFPQTLQAIGTLTGESFEFPVTYTDNSLVSADGWNLLGNPTTTTLDWSTLSAFNLNANAYLYQPSTSTWLIADGLGTGTVSDLIPTYTGFFVKATGASPTLTENPPAKSVAVLQSVPNPIIRLNAVQQEQAATFSVLFTSDAMIGMDHRDAYALASLGENSINIVSSMDGVMLSRQAVPSDFDDILQIPLDISSTLAGDIVVTSTFDDFPSDWTVTLLNNATDLRLNLRDVGQFIHSTATPMKAVPSADRLSNGLPIVQTSTGDESAYTLIIDRKSSTSVESDLRPSSFSLEQNFPNPFNPSTTIRFDVATQSTITLQIVDMTGRLIETLLNEAKAPGAYTISWNASELASGMYMLRMTSNHGVHTRKMTLIK